MAERDPRFRGRDLSERAFHGPELIGRRVAPPAAPKPRRWRRRIALVIFCLLTLPIAVIALYRVVPPPITPLMVIRNVEGLPIRQHWVGYRAIAPSLVAAVMTSEDEGFCSHDGFDLGAIREAWRDYRATGRLRGASTISQQTAKNLFLWPDHSFVRKAIEAYLTVLIEFLWPKQRILEVYLNIIEWGPGIYGAEVAAQTHFAHPAASLTRHEAALLAAVLPNPRTLSPLHPAPHVERRVDWILARMAPFLRGCGGG
ncbi:MAG: monofunctional biosynthetic peptidoglycan transglycosylase [Pseudomonadota bacterium]